MKNKPLSQKQKEVLEHMAHGWLLHADDEKTRWNSCPMLCPPAEKIGCRSYTVHMRTFLGLVGRGLISFSHNLNPYTKVYVLRKKD